MAAIKISEQDPNFKYELAEIPGGENIKRCFTCGTCSASCPVRAIEERYNPRQIIRKVLLGLKNEVLTSEFIWLCSCCHSCYEWCRMNVRFTEIIHALRIYALQEEKKGKIKIRAGNKLFAQIFVNSIKNHGRLWEPELMAGYFLRKGAFFKMMSYLPLGIQMLKKQKLVLSPPRIEGIKQVKEMFKKIKQLEERGT
jgi:heterodisulfide reductase subunit C